MDEQNTWFDEEHYLKSKLAQLHATEPTAGWTMQSLRDAITNAGLSPFSHFQAYGLQERTSPNPSFNAHEYLEAKLRQLQKDEPGKYNSIDEVADAIRDAGLGLWEHFNQYGWKEGVNPSNSFDINGYFDKKLAELQKNDPEGNWDIDKVKQAFEDAGLDPVSHYAAYGKDEEGVEPVEVPEEDRVPDDPRPPVDPEPEPEPEPEPGASFTVTESEDGVLSFGGSATGDITLSVDNDGVATFARDGIAAATTVILSEAELVKINLAESQQLLASGPQLDGLNIHFVGQGKVNIRDVQLTQATTAIVDGVMVARPASSNTNLAQIILPVSDDSADISINGSVGDLIKLSWIYFDQKYYEEFEETFPESYYDLPLTLAKAELSLKYIDYLKNNEPFTDFTAKTAVAGGVQTRDQSIHDNLLGELTQGALNDRLGGPDRTDELAYYTEAAGEFFYRPYNSGTTPGSNDSLAASVIWDLDHGIGRGETVEDGNVFVISKSSSTATSKDGVQDAIDGAGNGDIVYVGPGEFDGGLSVTNSDQLTILGTSLSGYEPSTIVADAENNVTYAIRAEAGFHGKVIIDGLTVVAGTQGGIGQFMSASAGQFHVLNNVVMTSEHSYTAHGNSIQISGDGSTVIGNTVEVDEYTRDVDSWSTSGITVVKDASNSVISNNMVSGPAGGISDNNSVIGIGVDGNYSTNGLENVQITENTLSNITSGISLNGKVEALLGGNTIGNNDVGISLGTTSAGWIDELDVQILGNTFASNGKAIALNDFDGGGAVLIRGNTFAEAEMAGAIWFNSSDSASYRTGEITIDLAQFSIGAGELADNVIYTGTAIDDISNIIGQSIQINPAVYAEEIHVSWTAGVFENLSLKLTGASGYDMQEINEFLGISL